MGPESRDRVLASAHDLADRIEGLLAQTRARVRRRGGAAPQPGGALAVYGDASRWKEWPPAVRLICGGAGAALIGYSATRKDAASMLFGLLGAGLLVSASLAGRSSTARSRGAGADADPSARG